MFDTTKTMRAICADEPLFESFLVLKGFPFSLENPIVDVVTFEDVVVVQQLDRDAFLGEFDQYKRKYEAACAEVAAAGAVA